MALNICIESASLIMVDNEQDIVYFNFSDEHVAKCGEVSRSAKMYFKRGTAKEYLEANNIPYTLIDTRAK